MLVLTQNNFNMPDNIKIVELDNNENCNKIAIAALTKKLMPQYYGGLAFFRGKKYNKMFAAIDENNGAMVGAALVINKKDIYEGSTDKVEFLDFLMVEESYRNKKVASNLINTVIEYAKSKNTPYVELMCARENSLIPNVYDKNEFNRISYHDINDVFSFRINVNKTIRNYGKVLYVALNESLREGATNFDQLKGIASDERYLDFLSMQVNIPKMKCKKNVDSPAFDLLSPVVTALLDEEKNIQSVDETLKGVLKFHSSKNFRIVKPCNKNFGFNDISKFYSYSCLDDYLIYKPQEVNFVKQVNSVAMDMTKDLYLMDCFKK